MSPRTVERVDDWETVPFGGGYSGLRDLATQEFSGVVTAGPTRLFMIRGTVVGVLDGSIDDFEDSSGTAHEAPHPALPLLAVMQERSDEVRAKYYTEDTPIGEVDRTLADGSFTGYVELSENVLSGDYYQVYHQGRSMSVAYVGSSGRLITDDEAFEQADDEVGIYEVRPVAIDPIEIPGPADDATGATAADDAVDTTAADEIDGDQSETEQSGNGPQGAPGDEGPATGQESAETPSASGESDTGDRTAGGSTVDARAPDESGTQESAAGADPDDPADGSRDVARDGTSAPAGETSTTDSTVDGEDTGPQTGQSRTGSEARRSDDSQTSTDAHPGASVSGSSQESSSSQNPPSSKEAPPSASRPSRGDGTTDDQPSQSRHASGDGQSQPAVSGTESTTSAAGADRANPDPSPSGTTQSADPQPGTQDGRTAPSGPSSGGGATDLEVRSIPSLDPARTSAASNGAAKQTSGGRSADAAQPSSSQRPQQHERSRQGEQPSAERSQQNSPERSGQGSRRQSGTAAPSESNQSNQPDRSKPEPRADGTESTQQVSAAGGTDLATELESREQEIEDLRTDLERVEAERDELETERAELEAERDRLQAELEEAEAEIERLTERLEDVAGEGDTAGTQLSKGEAVDNTNLFVRYRSKGDATLETAHSGNADRSAVAENMRLEYHTQFDADDTAVGNEPFDDFLTGTIQYRFVDWLIGSLLYEVRDTGHADGMADLYNALPKIDRAELNGQVSVTYAEDGEEHRSQERFDVVVRDRMGNPLFVANINDSRDPATDAMMTDLIKRAERVGESGDTLAGAFLVTESFFEPEALETAEGATSNGLFSRDKRKSFVNLSRKDGYHLCLVEARNQEFHLAVPEL